MRKYSLACLAALGLAVGASACDGGDGSISVTPPEPEPECLREAEPVSYEVFFVLDVSGSMEPFLRDVRDALVRLAEGFPEENAEGRGVRIDYYVIAFVNDFKVYGDGRMTSIIALQAAFDQAIQDGRDNFNLTAQTFNAEEQENLLDALSEVVRIGPTADARLVFLATDAPFVEAPAVLNENIQVQTSYSEVRSALESLEIRVHGFSKESIGGIFLNFNEQPPLTTLPGSTKHKLSELQGSVADLKNTLFSIAQSSACN